MTSKTFCAIFSKGLICHAFISLFQSYFQFRRPVLLFIVQHNTHYVIFNRCSVWRFYFLYNQAHILHTALMLSTGRNDINARGVNVGMSEDVSQFCNILFDAVKGSCE